MFHRVRAPCRSALGALLLVLAASAGSAQQRLSAVEPALRERIAEHQGRVGLAVYLPGSGERISIDGDLPFPAASLVKVPILIEVFHQAEHGRLNLDDPLIMLEVDKQPGSGVLQFLDAPHELTVADAAFLMIALSDNTATNLIIDEVGIRAVNERMDSLGAPRTTLHSKTFLRSTSIALDSSAVYGLGVTTPREMVHLLELIRSGRAVSADASARMLGMLREQFYGFGLPRSVPARVAHKTGDLEASRHDCGIVETGNPSSEFVMCVMTRENTDTSWAVDNAAHILIADLARIVHDHLTNDR